MSKKLKLKKKDVINLIKARIDSEYRKHHNFLDWSMVAAIKIYSELKIKKRLI